MNKSKKDLGTSPYMPYPDCDGRRTGCKVSWRYYRNREKAEECAVAARHNGRYDASRGYDFGYCSPGSVLKVEKGEYAGMFEVCIP